MKTTHKGWDGQLAKDKTQDNQHDHCRFHVLITSCIHKLQHSYDSSLQANPLIMSVRKQCFTMLYKSNHMVATMRLVLDVKRALSLLLTNKQERFTPILKSNNWKKNWLRVWFLINRRRLVQVSNRFLKKRLWLLWVGMFSKWLLFKIISILISITSLTNHFLLCSLISFRTTNYKIMLSGLFPDYTNRLCPTKNQECFV